VAVVRIRFNDFENLTSCQNFLQHAFPGSVERDGHALNVALRGGSLDPSAERTVVERLLWAWRQQHAIQTEDGVVVDASSNPPAGRT
jgi:hypothetical protein